MAGVRTYVSSYTYDTLLNIMYPDDHEKERSVQEVERLIVQGHTVEYRFGNNMSTVLDMDKFNEYVRPKYTDDPVPSNIQEVMFQNELDNLTPVAPEPERINLEQNNSIASVNLTPLQPIEPKKVEIEEKAEEVKEEKVTEEGKEKNKESTEENKEETTEEKPKSSIKPEENSGKQKKGGK